MIMKKKVVFSGIQPSGNIHLGNYLRAIRQWVAGQDEKINFFLRGRFAQLNCAARPGRWLRHETRSLAAYCWQQASIREKSTLFIQSHVSAHAEGCWLLNCVTPLGWLHRDPIQKDKSARQDSANGCSIIRFCRLPIFCSTMPMRVRSAKTRSSIELSRILPKALTTATKRNSSSYWEPEFRRPARA